MPQLRHTDHLEPIFAEPQHLEPVALRRLWPDAQFTWQRGLLYGISLLVLIWVLNPLAFVLMQMTGLSIYLMAVVIYLPLALLLLLLIDRVALA